MTTSTMFMQPPVTGTSATATSIVKYETSSTSIASRTLRSMSYSGDREDLTRWGRAGQTSTQIVVMTKPVQSWTYVPIGQSDRPESPHYTDQAEKLFSERTMQPTWWLPEDLARHIESRTELDPGL